MKGKQFGGHSGDNFVFGLRILAFFAFGILAIMIIIGLISKATKQGFENSESSNSMFLFANNKSKPSCCNFSYSSSNGCVCIDKEQQMLLHTRGGNRTIDADF